MPTNQTFFDNYNGAQTRYFVAPLRIDGTYLKSGGATTNIYDFQNAGLARVEQGILSLVRGRFAENSAAHVASAGIISIFPGWNGDAVSLANGSRITGEGVTVVSGGTLVHDSAHIDHLVVGEGVRDGALDNSIHAGGAVAGGGRLTVKTLKWTSGQMGAESAPGGETFVEGNVTLSRFANALVLSYGRTLTIASNMTKSFQELSMYERSTVGGAASEPGTLKILPGAVFEEQGGSRFGLFRPDVAGGSIVNQGTFRAGSAIFPTSVAVDTNLQNSGRIEVLSDLYMEGTSRHFANSVINIEEFRILAFDSGDHYIETGARVSGDGMIWVNNANLFTGDVQIPRLNLNSSFIGVVGGQGELRVRSLNWFSFGVYSAMGSRLVPGGKTIVEGDAHLNGTRLVASHDREVRFEGDTRFLAQQLDMNAFPSDPAFPPSGDGLIRISSTGVFHSGSDTSQPIGGLIKGGTFVNEGQYIGNGTFENTVVDNLGRFEIVRGNVSMQGGSFNMIGAQSELIISLTSLTLSSFTALSSVTLDGRLILRLGFAAELSTSFTAFTYVRRIGEFREIQAVGLSDQFFLAPTYDDANGLFKLTVTAVPEPHTVVLIALGLLLLKWAPRKNLIKEP